MTPERLAEFQALLGIADQARALRIWTIIEFSVPPMQWFERGRKTVPDAQKAKRHLSAIAAAAHKLTILVKREPLAPLLLSGGLFPSSLGPDGEIIFASDTEHEAFATAPKEFVQRLSQIAKTAQLFADDDERFRREHGLPNSKQGSSTPATLVLWPLLFDLWQKEGKGLAHTIDGPLHRFLRFVHRELGLPEPSASTLRDAIGRHVGSSSKTGD